MSVRPKVYFLGAPKCGTSALAEYIALASDVGFGAIKEPNFWSDDFPYFANRNGLRELRDYERLFWDDRSRQVIIDGSTHYAYSKNAVKNIYEYCPDARFVFCVRPQHELAHAWHMQMVNAGYETERDFFAAWKLIEARRLGQEIPTLCPERTFLDYEGIAAVGEQLGRLLRIVPPDRVLIVFQDEIRKYPMAVVNECCDFIGVHPPATVNVILRNESFSSRSTALSRLIRAPFVRSNINRMFLLLGKQRSERYRNLFRHILYRKSSRAALPEQQLTAVRNSLASDRQDFLILLRFYGLRRCTATPAESII